MIFLLLCIVSSSLIYVIFKVAKIYSCDLTSLITLNYMAATILGLFLFQPFKIAPINRVPQWIPFAIILGVLYILMFYLIGNSSQKAGITVTTLANKLSLIFPVLFSVIYFDENISTAKYIGIITAILAVLLTLYKKDFRKAKTLYFFLPVLIFFGSGLVDSIVKYVQALKISENEVTHYTIVVFFVAFLCGLTISVLRKNKKITFHYPTVLLGILLGAANFGSLFFIINALNKSALNSAMVFAVNNMLIVALTAIIGTLLFKEKLSGLNLAGIILAILSLYFLL